VIGWLLSAVVGVFYGVAATVGHASRFGVIPVGLILASVGTAALLIALRALTGDRINALAGGVGVVAATFLFSQVGPGGSAIVAAATPDTEWIAVAWTIVGPLIVALVAGWPDLSKLTGGQPARS